MKILLLMLSLIVVLPVDVFALTISLPYSNTFDTAQDLTDTNDTWSGNASQVWYHDTTGGWNNSPCVRSQILANGGNVQAGLGEIHWASQTTDDPDRTPHTNVGFLFYAGADYTAVMQDGGQKFILMLDYNSDGTGVRPKVFQRDYYMSEPFGFTSFAPCADAGGGCEWEDGGDNPSASDAFHIEDYENEWIWMEFEVVEGVGTRLYIYTQDGVFSGLLQAASAATTRTQYGIQHIGAYWTSGATTTSPEGYFKIDNLEVSTSFIGPPVDFLTGGTPVVTDNNLPFAANFETGDLSEFNGGATAAITVTTGNTPPQGTYVATAPLTNGTHSDNYADFYFGDHINGDAQGTKVEEVWLELDAKVSSGYLWPVDSHKIALFNLTNGVDSLRKYQIIIQVNSDGEYIVDNTYMDDWLFFGNSQNTNLPASSADGDHWDNLKLHVVLNTAGAADGVIQLWVNDVLKIDYSSVNIRENTSYGMNKFIMSSYATDASLSDGFSYWDDVYITDIDPSWGGAEPDPDPPVTSSIKYYMYKNAAGGFYGVTAP